MRILIVTVATVVLAFASLSYGAVYQCNDASGTTIFSDRLCTIGCGSAEVFRQGLRDVIAYNCAADCVFSEAVPAWKLLVTTVQGATVGKPIDQFDSVATGNPFDQFDSPCSDLPEIKSVMTDAEIQALRAGFENPPVTCTPQAAAPVDRLAQQAKTGDVLRCTAGINAGINIAPAWKLGGNTVQGATAAGFGVGPQRSSLDEQIASVIRQHAVVVRDPSLSPKQRREAAGFLNMQYAALTAEKAGLRVQTDTSATPADEQAKIKYELRKEYLNPGTTPYVPTFPGVINPINHGMTNPVTGEFLAPAGPGYVGTRDGRLYVPAGPSGIIDTRTGQFIPVH